MSVAGDSWAVVSDESDASISTGVVVASADDVVSISTEDQEQSQGEPPAPPSVPQDIAIKGKSEENGSSSLTDDGSSDSDALADTDIPSEGCDIDAPVDRYARAGKRSLKHSLVKRWPQTSMYLDWPRHTDEYIEVVSRTKKGFGLVSKTVLDDNLPELIRRSTATLGCAGRWKSVIDLLDSLEADGKAIRQALNEPTRFINPRFHQCESMPHEKIKYSVKSNGTINQSTRQKKTGEFNQIIMRHCNESSKWKVWYGLSLEQPPVGDLPLHGSLRAPAGMAPLRGGARKAFTPGVAPSCGAAATHLHVASAKRAVVGGTVDLVFGRNVAVTHASLAGKIHDTSLEALRVSKFHSRGWDLDVDDSFKPLLAEGALCRLCLVGIEGTDAYCTRVQISARISLGPTRRWVDLGVFDACKDGHNEVAIPLGGCVAASPDGAVRCVALRFRAVSWRNKPLLRVGAYGQDLDCEVQGKKGKQPKHSEGSGFDDGVEYILHRAAKHQCDLGHQRRYALKGRSCKIDAYDDHTPRAARRSQLRKDIKEEQSFRWAWEW
eukprot:CAMPEP_0183295960 /NCGR_PEP_ID=MMETSP0160_2-20130417/3714_1 /TAXON_ID=2839 ORGANISM="Odontella Sinensis, Strain Grunow 1884" /NCGR_SAMPLE_ID=MMETSP0160_2 /ASSEMBLY_ACC=CAM_ASM_000250 /LENGTH=549 /DNA_ID=CAMNT_0025457511 /DNA_START=31 /DNA_END=1680 /DNA_ORIENTATION=-